MKIYPARSDKFLKFIYLFILLIKVLEYSFFRLSVPERTFFTHVGQAESTVDFLFFVSN